VAAENTGTKTSIWLNAVAVLVGLLAFIVGIVDLFPFKFFGVSAAGAIVLLSLVIPGTMLLVVGAFSLASAFSSGFSSLTKQIGTLTSVLTILVALTILFFQLVSTGEHWLNLLFGIGLLSYGVGLVAFGALPSECNSGLRLFTAFVGVVIAFLGVIVSASRLVHVYSDAYYTYAYFVNIAFILIGFDCLVTVTLNLLLKKGIAT